MKTLLKWIKRLFLLIIGIVILAVFSGWLWLRGSLALLDGDLEVSGLNEATTIARNRQGIVDITGQSRNDIAFALGFAHAQERFFQMDLLRRNSSGELSGLFGSAAFEYDSRIRNHRFRWRAIENFKAMQPESRSILTAYTNGVNQGLDELATAPWEYAVLRTKPRQWTEADSLLAVYSMNLVLQDDLARFERGLGLMADSLPQDLFDFFTQQGGEWDSPLFGEALPAVEIPESGWSDLLDPQSPLSYETLTSEDRSIGSNNWAVSGQLTEHGAALVADDMHLAVRVPNIWFRASWLHPQTGYRVSGATLPGFPMMVVGSNGKVAWGFTNSQGDWSDVITLDVSPDGSQYQTADGLESFALYEEEILIKGSASKKITIRETRWGPVIATNHRQQPMALRWVAHDPQAMGESVYAMERVSTVDGFLKLAPTMGLPHQNLVMGDDEGNIAWTIGGSIPQRNGPNGRLPQPGSAFSDRWSGYFGIEDHPSWVNPPDGRIWTANARVVSGEMAEKTGYQGAALGARQGQIRKRLLEHDVFDEQTMLDIQLDDEALFLARWRLRLLDQIDHLDGERSSEILEAQGLVKNWQGRATAGDAGYRIVRQFRLKVLEYVTAPLATYLQNQNRNFRLNWVNSQIEHPVWSLLSSEPEHLLNHEFSSWNELQIAALRAVLKPWYEDGTLTDNTWGEQNILRTRHPLANALPPVDWFLSMPAIPMDGDSHMPRVQTPTNGASQRFAISPGHEDSAYFHMATGQSAHPLSPFFGAGHDDWVEGTPSPLYDANVSYKLTLIPTN